MKILESIQEILSKLGITSTQSDQKYPFNVRNMMCLFCFILMSISAFTFLIIEAGSVKEYLNILNTSLTSIIMGIEFILHLWKRRKLFEFIVNFEDLIQGSAYNIVDMSKKNINHIVFFFKGWRT